MLLVVKLEEKPAGGDRRARKIQGWREGFGRAEDSLPPGLVRSMIRPSHSPRSWNQSTGDSEGEILQTPQIFPSFFVDDGVYPPPNRRSGTNSFFLIFPGGGPTGALERKKERNGRIARMQLALVLPTQHHKPSLLLPPVLVFLYDFSDSLPLDTENASCAL